MTLHTAHCWYCNRVRVAAVDVRWCHHGAIDCQCARRSTLGQRAGGSCPRGPGSLAEYLPADAFEHSESSVEITKSAEEEVMGAFHERERHDRGSRLLTGFWRVDVDHAWVRVR